MQKTNMKLEGLMIIVVLVYRAQCDDYCYISCSAEEDPVCGNDGETYSNLCQLVVAKECNNKQGLIADHYGKCNQAVTGKEPKCASISSETECPTITKRVCGSDNQTYSNECELCAAMYRQQQNGKDYKLRIIRPGYCLISASNPDCTPDTRDADCTSDYSPMCGSDGRTYYNNCMFCKEFYKWKEVNYDLKVQHHGRCSPDDYCSHSSKHGICSFEFNPVCANDGKTYSTICTMCSEMYVKQNKGQNITLQIVHHGKCTESTSYEELNCDDYNDKNACTREENLVCGSNGDTFANPCTFCRAKQEYNDKGVELNVMNKEFCGTRRRRRRDLDVECSDGENQGICTKHYAPVCASNEVTYENKCLFCHARFQLLQTGQEITLVRLGKCFPNSDHQELIECDPDSMKTGACPRIYSPVCAFNGETYGNECEFCHHKYLKSQQGIRLEAKHFGKCEADDYCSESSKNSVTCSHEFNPVCGSDGYTYSNLCSLCNAIYEQQSHELKLKHHGECENNITPIQYDFCSSVRKTNFCTKEYKPVCGSDGQTYANLCSFCNAKFKKEENNENLKISYFDPCKTIDKRAIPIEVECWMNEKMGLCTREFLPLCGSDGRTYSNKCTFCFALAQYEQQGKDLRLSHEGECRPRLLQCSEMSKNGACTYEYQPVCGNNRQSYANECMLCSEQHRRKMNGENVFLYIRHDGEC